MTHPKIKITVTRAVLWLLLFALTLFFMVVQTGRLIQTNKSVIREKQGIEENVYPVLGGKIQYVQIRSDNKSNPIIVMLHGGPGEPLSTWNSWYQRSLEKDFLVVNWDQRGSGRTYYLDDGRSGQQQTNVYSLIRDLDDLIEYLRQRFDRKKIMLVGFDWGSWLGTAYAQIHPDKLYAYVGVGQMTLSGQNMAVAVADEAIKLAKTRSDKAAIESLSNASIDVLRLRQYSTDNAQAIYTLWQNATAYLGTKFPTDWLGQAWRTIMSPNLRGDDMRWQLTAFMAPWIKEKLNSELMAEYYFGKPVSQRLHYDLPFFIVQGADDEITPTSVTRTYFDQITAHQKRYYTVSYAGHAVFKDAPNEFSQICKQILDEIPDWKPSRLKPENDMR